MTKKEIIEAIEEKVIDVIETDFEFHNTSNVPNSDDTDLTFEYGNTKKGKTIKTCVLYVDIRDSVALTQKHDTETMGKVYTAFTKAVILSAQHHNGYIRNIIGDRVMVVFEPDNCFTNAVDCAITINHISQYIINEKFKDVNFKCGIGIDYGEFNVIKVGVAKKGDEKHVNKNLAWVGEPANIASRLTDVANKKIIETYFEVIKRTPVFRKSDLKLEYKTKTMNLSVLDFAKTIKSSDGQTIEMDGFKQIKSFKQKQKSYNIPPILMTSSVFEGFKEENPERRRSITENLWKEIKYPIKSVSTKVYGEDIHWEI